MGNKFSAKLAGLCIGGILIATPLSASAHSNTSSLLNQKNSIVQQKQQIKSDLSKFKAQVADLTEQISKRQIEVGKNQDEVTTLNKSIAETKDRLESRQDLLKERMKSAYINGGSSVDVLGVLLNSKNFGDFINRAVAVYNITDQDNNIIKKQQKDQETMEKQYAKVQSDLEDSKTKLKELNQLVAKVEALQTQKQDLLSGLSNKENALNSRLNEAKSANNTSSVIATVAKTATETTTEATGSNSNNTSSSNSSNGITQMAYIPSNVASGNISDIVSAARKYIGHSSYVFGALDPANGRFDCSGFVNWAYNQIGINLGSRSTSGLQYVGQPVSKGNLQPGDLVFFDTYKHNGHVGIYLGNGQFLGSQSSTGVAIVNLNDPYYWGPRYSMARRVFN